MKCKTCSRNVYGREEREELCDDCKDDTLPLIKVDDHYVAHSYKYWGDSGKPMLEAEDSRCEIPSLSFDKTRDKWKLSFIGPDCGGYDCMCVTWWFDTMHLVLYAMLEVGKND